MLGDLFHNRYRIASPRAIWHDYNGGIYFVTICTKGRVHYFGEISHGDSNVAEPIVNLTIIGQYTNIQFSNVTSHYPYAKIPLWVVMPNHIHAVVIIEGNEIPYDNRMGEPMKGNIVETMCTSSLREKRWKHNDIDVKMQNVSLHRGKLSTAIGGLKRAISRYAHENAIPFAWQPRFHDRIIRNTDEMNRIAEYIEQNVAKWSYDELYS